jgi:endoglucanase
MSFIAILALLPLALGGLTAGTTYTISPSSHTDYCLAPASATEGADLVLKKCDASSDIVFTLDGDQLKNTETNMCIDIRHGDNESGTLAQMWGCYSNNPNQQFDVVGDEMKWIGRDKCLDLKDGEGSEGNGVQIWSCYSHNTNQKWTFTEAEEVDGDDCETGTFSLPLAT